MSNKKQPRQKHKAIEDFVTYVSEGSQMTYRYALNKYFDFLQVDPDAYLGSARDFNKDVMDYAKEHNNSPPKSQQLVLAVLKGFFNHNNVVLKTSLWNDVKRRNHVSSRSIVDDFVPTNNDLKILFTHCTNAKDKALFMMLATTGMRIDEVLQLKLSDIEQEKRHITVKASISKTRTQRHTFFTEETAQVLQEWLKERPAYIINSFRKSPYTRDQLTKQGITLSQKDGVWHAFKDGQEFDVVANEPRVFPFCYENASFMFLNMIRKAGAPYSDKDTNEQLNKVRHKFHIHCFRKFWAGSFSSTAALKAHVDTMMGHQSSLDKKYVKIKVEDLKKTYDEFSYCLSIFSDKKEFTEKTLPEINSQKTMIASLMKEISDMRLIQKSMEQALDMKLDERITQRRAEQEALQQ